MGAIMLHCWKDCGQHVEEVFGSGSVEHWDFVVHGKGGTCMLREGHPGPHEWTDDTEIVVSLVEVQAHDPLR
jgi:hypothetical protein